MLELLVGGLDTGRDQFEHGADISEMSAAAQTGRLLVGIGQTC